MPDEKLTPEEQLAMTQARESTRALVAQLGKPVVAPMLIDQLECDEGSSYVSMMVPKQFQLTIKGTEKAARRVNVPAGVRRFPEVHHGEQLAKHWYVKACGCEPYEASRHAKGAVPGAAGAPQIVEVAAPILGTTGLPNEIEIGDNKIPLGQFVLSAHKASGLSIDAWNGMTEEDRDEMISAAITTRKAAYRATQKIAEQQKSSAA